MPSDHRTALLNIFRVYLPLPLKDVWMVA